MFKVLLSLIILSSASSAFAQWHLLEPREVYMDAYKNDTIHDPYLAPEDADLGYGSNFITNFDIIKFKGYGLHWDNTLHFDQSDKDGQVRAAGWQYGLYLTVFRLNDKTKIEMFKQHHSQHILDRERDVHFPVYDRTGLRFVIYERDYK